MLGLFCTLPRENVILVQITISLQEISRTEVWLKPLQAFREDLNEPFYKLNLIKIRDKKSMNQIKSSHRL